MKSKGFTLIELLAVIVILGVILGITTVSVLNIKEKQDEKNFENTISSILTAAKEYNAETRISSVPVSDLKSGGYVDYDENDKYKNKSYYDYFNSKNVVKGTCPNALKKNYSITVSVDGVLITYNDCGCDTTQDSSVDSEKICK